MSLTGSGPDDPQRVGVPIADLLAGMYGAYGVLAALMERERTGRGQVVRTSLLAAIVGVHAARGRRGRWPGTCRAPRTHHPVDRPVRLFHCAGGSVQLSCGSRDCGASSAPSSASTPTPRGWPPTASGSGTGSR